MEQSRLNRPCVIPAYTAAEMTALLRDLLHSSLIVAKKIVLIGGVRHLNETELNQVWTA